MSDRFKQAIDRITRWPVHHPVATLLIAAAILAWAGWSTSRLALDPRLESLLPTDAPSTDSLTHVIHDFHLLDEALILVEAPPSEGPENDQKQEQNAAELEAFAGRFEKAVQIDEMAARLIQSVEHRAGNDVRRFIETVVVPAAGLYLDEASFAALLERLSPKMMQEQMRRNETMIGAGSPAADQLAKQILRDPLRLHDIIVPALASMLPDLSTWRGGEVYLSPKARSLLIRISAKGPATDMEFTRQLMALLHRAADEAAPGRLHLHFGGAYAIAQFSEKHIRANMIASITGTIILIQLLFLAAYRRISSFPLVFAPVAGGVLLGFGIYAALFGTISPITAGIGAILAGLGVDYSIHFLSHYESARSRGESSLQATDVRRGLGASLLHACATSMIGFLAIMASTIPAMRDFAVLGALGLFGALLGTVTILPAALVLLDQRRLPPSRPQVRHDLQPLLRRLAGAKRIRLATVLLVLGALALAVFCRRGALWFDSDMRAMHPQPNAPLETQDLIATQFGLAPDSMLIHLRAGSAQELLALAASVNDSVEAASLGRLGVRSCLSPATFLPDARRMQDRRKALDGLDRSQVIASFRKAVAGSLFRPDAFAAYEGQLDSLLNPGAIPDLATLARFPTLARTLLPTVALVDPSRPPTQAMAFVQLGRPMKSHVERDELVDAMRLALVHLPGAQLTGLSIVGRDIELAVRRELPRIGLAALIVVVGWVALLYRRPSLILLALLPVTVCAIAVLVVLRVTGTGLNMINMAAVPILAGTAIDNGIFLVSAAHVAARRQEPELILAALADRCHAMTLCSLTTIFGFGSLMFTSVPAIASLGLMLATGMTGCWIASVLIVAPGLIKVASPSTSEHPNG